MNTKWRRVWALLCGLCGLIGAVIACEAQARNMTINGTPLYICPSSTPRPTDVLPPPAPPTYPSTFLANVNYAFVDPARSVVNIQYLAQSVGWVQVSYWGTTAGLPWSGSGGWINVAYAGIGAPGFGGAYAVVIPPDVTSAQILFASAGGSYAFGIARYPTTISPLPAAASPPCCLQAPIYPTPRPTYTPYPTPTLFAMTQDYFLDDPVYNYAPPVQLRLRLKSPIRWGAIFFLNWTAASWTLEITNVGTLEYDFLGAGYMYVSEVKESGGALKTGVWSPAHNAAQFLGVIEQAYGPHAIRPKYEFFGWFEAIVISREVKLAKPDPRIYTLLLERIGRRADECVFIDDTPVNISTADRLGFQTIRYESPEQLETALRGVGLL